MSNLLYSAFYYRPIFMNIKIPLHQMMHQLKCHQLHSPVAMGAFLDNFWPIEVFKKIVERFFALPFFPAIWLCR